MSRTVAAAGAFLISLDSTLNIAFPAMAAWFERPPESMRWVIVSYVLTYSLTSFAGGALADRLGLARVFRAGVALSAVAYVLAAAAPAFTWLIAARVVQGIAGGLVYGTSPALVTAAAAPNERGRALAVLNASIGTALALGPAVAGLLLEVFQWQAVFVVRLPIALLVLSGAWRALPDSGAAAGVRLVGIRDLARAHVVHACTLSYLANAGIFAIWLLAPFYLVNRRGLDPVAGGLYFMLTPLGTAVAAPVAGRLADRLGGRMPAIAGLALEASGLLALSQATESTPALAVAAALLAAGFGLGLFQVPNMTAVMAAFPPGQQGAAGGLSFMARTLGVVSGVVTFAAIFATRRAAAGFEAAFTAAFLVAAGAVAAAALAATLPERARRGDRR
ncbi:MAG: MFS transporter [Candidatus Rokubacteria bacterium]|nr:MFS transporter [Candidatus Rokubacteria bacterium]